MTTRLKKITLVDWKCYQDETIELDSTDSQNIAILFGENGYGKTSLMDAIQWCLYGKKAISTGELVEYFNRVEVEKGASDVDTDEPCELTVELTFERGGKTISVRRSARRIVRGGSVSARVDEPLYIIDGKAQLDPELRIEHLLPSSCSQFFFFDGVQIKRYATNVHDEDTREAIERVLGIPELRNLRDDAERARRKIDDKLASISSADTELVKTRHELDDLAENQQTLADQLKLAQDELTAGQRMLADLNAEAAQLDGLRGKFEELERRKRDVDRLRVEHDQSQSHIDTVIQQTPIALLLPLICDAVEGMQRESVTTARRAGSVAHLRSLLECEDCVCGRPLDGACKKHIESLIAEQEGGSGDSLDVIRQDNMRNDLVSLSRFTLPDVERLWLKRDAIADQLEEAELAMQRIKSETGDIEIDQERDVWKRIGEVQNDVNKKRLEIDRHRITKTDLDKVEDELRKRQSEIAGRNEQTANVAQQSRLAIGLHAAACDLVEWRLAERKESIEQLTTEVHQRVTNKKDEYKAVVINEDYSLGVLNARGETLRPQSLSAGEKEALAFAFITGLNLASETAAPFVMDTPFGHLDVTHQRNLVNALPELPSQVVLLATSRDLPKKLLGEIRGHVSNIYRISRRSAMEDGSVIREES